MTSNNQTDIELTILMPCLNEAESIGACISKANNFISKSNIHAEILIADNGSADDSIKISKDLGARIINITEKGYGSALRAGIKSAKGKFIILGDADNSYDFYQLDSFINKLRDGYDLVMGNRFRGGIKPGAMPPLHKYLGNPVLSSIGRLFFKSDIGDFHCGLRGLNKDSIEALNLVSTGMEFASEMVVKATLAKYRIAEVPTTLSKDMRSRAPHLRSWRDGWRHLRFLLMYSPRWLFLYPGLFLFATGIIGSILVLPGPLKIGRVVFDVHTLLLSNSAILVGAQIIFFFLLAKKYATRSGFLPLSPRFSWLTNILSLEKTLLLGSVMLLFGVIGIISAVAIWFGKSLGELDYSLMLRLIIPSVTLLSLGILIIMSGFLSGILDIEARPK